MNNGPHLVPSPIAVALQTGRPELARIGMQSITAKDWTPERAEEIAKQISDFSEAMVRDLQRERENLAVMLSAVTDAKLNVKGALGTVMRLEEALVEMNKGADPETILAVLRNPNRDKG